MDLLRLDPSPSIYLNRPCYGQLNMPIQCEHTLWTSARYSEKVIASMNKALDQIKVRYGLTSFSVIGYSGGGTIATLLAKRRDDILQLITVAGNLDHEQWTSYFAYLPLSTSLNAVDAFPLEHVPFRLHMIGKLDTRVPLSTNMAAAQKDHGAKIKMYSHFNHVCCWQEEWLQILEQIHAHPSHPNYK